MQRIEINKETIAQFQQLVQRKIQRLPLLILIEYLAWVKLLLASVGVVVIAVLAYWLLFVATMNEAELLQQRTPELLVEGITELRAAIQERAAAQERVLPMGRPGLFE